MPLILSATSYYEYIWVYSLSIQQFEPKIVALEGEGHHMWPQVASSGASCIYCSYLWLTLDIALHTFLRLLPLLPLLPFLLTLCCCDPCALLSALLTPSPPPCAVPHNNPLSTSCAKYIWKEIDLRQTAKATATAAKKMSNNKLNVQGMLDWQLPWLKVALIDCLRVANFQLQIRVAVCATPFTCTKIYRVCETASFYIASHYAATFPLCQKLLAKLHFQFAHKAVAVSALFISFCFFCGSRLAGTVPHQSIEAFTSCMCPAQPLPPTLSLSSCTTKVL